MYGTCVPKWSTMIDIELINISKHFGDTIAVDDASFSVNKGEFLTLLGPSGCGKTTTLRMIAGFTKPTQGSIYIDGELVNEKPPYERNIGMVFQNYSLFPHMTTYDNLAFGLKMRKVSENEIKRRVKETFELIALSGYEDRYPGQLSGGEQQRIALGRALIIEPNVLLLDEPLSNLDLKLRQKLRLDLKRIQKEVDITSIYVTHDQEEALILSDRIALMNKGQIVQIGNPKEMYENPKNRFVADFIGETNFLSGELISRKGSWAEIELDDGTMVHASLRCIDYHDSPLEKDNKVILSLRPHNIILTRTKPRDEDMQNLFEGKIKDLEYVGSLVKYHVELKNGFALVAQDSLIESEKYSLGETVYLTCSPKNFLVISGTSDKILI